MTDRELEDLVDVAQRLMETSNMLLECATDLQEHVKRGEELAKAVDFAREQTRQFLDAANPQKTERWFVHKDEPPEPDEPPELEDEPETQPALTDEALVRAWVFAEIRRAPASRADLMWIAGSLLAIQKHRFLRFWPIPEDSISAIIHKRRGETVFARTGGRFNWPEVAMEVIARYLRSIGYAPSSDDVAAAYVELGQKAP